MSIYLYYFTPKLEFDADFACAYLNINVSLKRDDSYAKQIGKQAHKNARIYVNL